MIYTIVVLCLHSAASAEWYTAAVASWIPARRSATAVSSAGRSATVRATSAYAARLRPGWYRSYYCLASSLCYREAGQHHTTPEALLLPFCFNFMFSSLALYSYVFILRLCYS